MNRRTKLTLLNWGSLATLFLIFLNWHGAFEGPLTSAEIDMYMARLGAPDVEADFDGAESVRNIREFLEADDGKPFVMVNAIQVREVPLSADGATGQEAADAYEAFVTLYLLRRGSYPIYTGTAAANAVANWGIENGEEWSSAGLVRYSSRRTMIEMTTDPEFQQNQGNKFIGIEKTIAYPTTVDIQVIGLGWFVGFMDGLPCNGRHDAELSSYFPCSIMACC
ncbi:MAG: hypothetical protein AAF633_14670 [Chloroflexota bacterium]